MKAERDGKACKAKEKPPWPADPQSWERGPQTPKAGSGALDPQIWERGPRPLKLGEGPGAECSPLLGSDGAGLAPLISNSRLQSEDAVGVKFPQGCLSLCGHLGSMFRTVRPPSAWPSSPRLPPSGWRWTAARASLAAAAPSC